MMKADALNVWGGPDSDPKNDWVSDFDDSDDIRSLKGSDDERKSKMPPTIDRQEGDIP